ncbi:MAG TPA: hypothetical protein VFM38_15100 [Candidatus Limnocylindrales bacterium]|nr:hypothetical protein [Candidatus Limnocylindrales bacterium]
MRVAPAPTIPRSLRSSDGAARVRERTRRRPVRPLDDGTTELVHVIEFVLPAGDSIQPVIWLDRQLLD